MTDYLIQVGERLREIRKEKELTQIAVAKYLGFATKEAYGHYERGDRELSLGNLVKYCKLTSANADYILSGEGQKYSAIKKDRVDIALDVVISKLGIVEKKLLLGAAQGLEENQKGADDK